MSSNLTDLESMIAFGAYQEGRFTLKSGRISDYYIDLKSVMTDPRGITLIGKALLDLILLQNNEYMNEYRNEIYVGGMALGAVPIVTSVLIESQYRGLENRIKGFYVRSPKDH